jgi:hypothetical protein
MAERAAEPVTEPAAGPTSEPPRASANEHGPGLTWLAARVGCSPEELLADPHRLVDSLADAERAMTGLGLRLGSDDAALRADAEVEAEWLRRMFADAPEPGVRFRAAVLGALRDAADRVRRPA